MKKVLEVNIDDRDSGGVYALIKNVISHNSSNIKIDIAAIEHFKNEDNIHYFESLNCSVFYVGYEGNKFRKQFIVYKNLSQLIKNGKYEYVHIHADTSNKLLVSALAAKNVKTPNIILHSHSSGIDGDHRRIKLVIHKLCRRLLKRIGTKFVACSDYAANWMFPNLKNYILIKNGIDLKRFRFDASIRNEVRLNLNVKERVLIGHVGRFLYQKNHEYLISICEELTKRNIDFCFLLVGEGERLEYIKRLVHEKNLEERVVFYGISNRVNELMMAMDIFLLPSHFEGLPIVGVEAQASGLPVLFSDHITKEANLSGDVTYLGIDSKDVNAWADRICELTRIDKDRKKANDKLVFEKYDIRDTVDSFIDLYKG